MISTRTIFLLLFFICVPLFTSFSQPQIIEIVCKRSYFEPNSIHVQSGKPVRIVLKAEDVAHGFALDEFNIAREIAPGSPTVIEFTPNKSGTFEFYCVVRCGKDHLNMRGTLIVE